ncbi:hypothetical protein GGX14DRAFT_466677, partial [Mycena pura]
MASIRLRALPGASLLVIPTSSGISFHIENSGGTEDSHDAPEIVLTSSPEGVRIVIQHQAVSGDDPTTSSGASDSFTNATMFSQPELDMIYTQMAPANFFHSLEGMGSALNGEGLNMDWFLFSHSPEDITAGGERIAEDCNLGWNFDRVTRTTRSRCSSSASPPSSSPSIISESETSPYSPGPSIPVVLRPPPTASDRALKFPCRFPGCDRICSRQHTRAKHEETHRIRVPLSCSEPGCTTTFSRSHDKLRHEVRTHNRPCHRCPVCHTFFATERRLGRHKCKQGG